MGPIGSCTERSGDVRGGIVLSMEYVSAINGDDRLMTIYPSKEKKEWNPEDEEFSG